MTRVYHVAIVGAGLAGLACAVAAADAGMRVEVFEAAPALAAPPAPIDVVPNLLRDLVSLGLGPACTGRGFAYRDAAVVHTEGAARYTIPTPPLAGPRHPAAQGMLYGELLRVLHDAAVERGVQMHWDARIAAIEPQGARARLQVEQGGECTTDLVVLAGATGVDGVALPLPHAGARLPQRWDHLLIPRPRDLDQTTWFIGPGPTKCLLVPVSVTQAGLALLVDEREDPPPQPSTASQLRERLQRAGTTMARLGALLPAGGKVVARPVRTGLLGAPWHEGAVLRVGSNAHLLPPHFGQAAAQSVEDAVVLGELLGAGLERLDLMTRFSERRAGRAAWVHSACTQAAGWDLQPGPGTNLADLAERLQPVIARPA